MKVGDRVKVDLSGGCPDKCGRRDVYEGTILSFDHPLGHSDMVQVNKPHSRINPWEHKSCVTALRTEGEE